MTLHVFYGLLRTAGTLSDGVSCSFLCFYEASAQLTKLMAKMDEKKMEYEM